MSAKSISGITAAFLAVAASPVVAGSAIAIAILSRRSPFVAHLRMGQHGKPLWVLKLRTMWQPGPPLQHERGWVEHIVAEPESDRKDPADSRVRNRFASFCRKHSIDELPQFLHVIRGEMALVGPRPLTSSELHRHYGTLTAKLLSVKPGLTGLWQVQGRSALSWNERVRLDLEMVEPRSHKECFTILVRTMSAIKNGNGAW